MLPRDALTKTMVRQAIDALERHSASMERGSRLKCRPWQRSSRNIPSPAAMHGVGDSLGPQLMAELGM